MVHEQLERLTTKGLTSQQVLKPNTIAKGQMWWTCAGNRTASIGYIINTNSNTLTLHYTLTSTQQQVKQTITLQAIASNLNRGKVYYFLCPYTGYRVRTLYLIGGRFRSRHAVRGLYYRSQVLSRYDRYNERYWKVEKQIEQLTGKGYTHTYRGSLTATAKRVQALETSQQHADWQRWQPQHMPTVIRNVLQGHF